jgi:hypothetical protein
MPEDSVDADLDDGTASLVLRHFEIDDHGDVANALSGGRETTTASLSLRIDWSGVMRRVSFVDAQLPTPFAAYVALTGATMCWSAVEGGRTIGGLRSSTPDFAMAGEGEERRLLQPRARRRRLASRRAPRAVASSRRSRRSRSPPSR